MTEERQKAHHDPLDTAIRWTAVIVVFFLLFAVLRYNVIRGVSYANFPLYIGNKVLAMTAVTLLSLSYILGPLRRFLPIKETLSDLRKFLGLFGYGTAALHAICSLMLFTPVYYPKLFVATGKLSLMGELAMLFGVISFGLFGIITIISIPSVAASLSPGRWKTIQRSGYYGLAFVGLHVLVMSYAGWLKPDAFQYGVIPLSLTAVLIVAVTLLVRVLSTVIHPQTK